MRVLRPLVLSLLLVLGGGITALSAQNREVSGKVLDANQQPLVGVAVLVDGTTKGVTTSENGTFKIQVPSGEAVLQVTCLGYLPQKVTVPSSRNSITIYLQEDAIMLDATVVIGYGTQKKVNLTGAVATVGSKELENRVTHSLGSMLQGSVAGLNITTSSGKPGSTPAINIRGVNSINSADPLVLIDGVVGDLNRVNPNDVESISVIKDASAAAVYGARAAFGVILVTTKNGSAQDGKATVRYSGRFGWEEATTSTDYENRGYWSVYTVNKFWQADSGTNSYDRTVMAVPGRITDRASAGTNHLIRNRKAQLVLTADDVIRELMWDLGENPATLRAKPPTPELTPDEAGLLGCFRTDDPLSVEALGELTGLNPGELATLLVGLELAGAVRQLPGNRYMKL